MPVPASADSDSMSNECHGPLRATPSIVDRIALAMSIGRHLDGIWIGSWSGRPADLTRVEQAMLLAKQHSPLNYARIIRDLERIWVFLLPHGLGQYQASLKACLLDERYVADPATSIERVASTIVHEATHARLQRYGIGYEEERRARIEAICFRRELAFATRLPDGAQLRQEIIRYLDWYQANPDYFSDAQFQKRRTHNEIEALRYLKTPDWLIRAYPVLQSLKDQTRKLFRFGSRVLASFDRQWHDWSGPF
jgi:hypothetical protein